MFFDFWKMEKLKIPLKLFFPFFVEKIIKLKLFIYKIVKKVNENK